MYNKFIICNKKKLIDKHIKKGLMSQIINLLFTSFCTSLGDIVSCYKTTVFLGFFSVCLAVAK